MNRSTNESGEDRLVSKDQRDSPSIDNGSCEEGFEGVVLKKGPWTPAEDAILVDYVKKHGEGNWNSVQKHSGLFRCGKSCRLRWANHLRPNLKKGAFTADEERLIIELHAKMGNKWARMAAHLPGRTDNEIKNYWNTRIKRLQRAGLPLYPPDVCLQTVNEIQPSQNTNEFNSMYTQHDLQKKDYESPDVVFGNLNTKRGFLSYAPVLPDISVGNMLTQQLGSSQNSFIPPSMYRPKRLRESENLFPSFNSIGGKKHKSFGLPFPYDPDPFGARHGSHAFLNGNTISASKPIHGAVKLELPSFQYPETDCGLWGMSSPLSPLLDTVDSFFQSPPPTQLVQSDCLSSCTSGLLGEMFHDSKTFNREKNLSCDPSMNSSVVTSSNVLDGSTSNMGETEWGEFSDPISPLGHSVASVFRECTSINGSNIKNPEPVELVATPVGRDAESLNQFDFSSPDTSLGAGWFDQSYECAKDHSFMNDAIASLLGEDLCSDYNNIHDGMSTMNQGSGPGFIPWNNFAAFCQMPDLH